MCVCGCSYGCRRVISDIPTSRVGAVDRATGERETCYEWLRAVSLISDIVASFSSLFVADRHQLLFVPVRRSGLCSVLSHPPFTLHELGFSIPISLAFASTCT